MAVDYISISEDKEKPKTIKLEKETWKVLSQYKLDSNKSTFNEVVKELLEGAGY